MWFTGGGEGGGAFLEPDELPGFLEAEALGGRVGAGEGGRGVGSLGYGAGAGGLGYGAGDGGVGDGGIGIASGMVAFTLFARLAASFAQLMSVKPTRRFRRSYWAGTRAERHGVGKVSEARVSYSSLHLGLLSAVAVVVPQGQASLALRAAG